jgi:tight adherence protein B
MPVQHLLYLAILSAALLMGILFLFTHSAMVSLLLGLAGLGAPTLVLHTLKRARDGRFLTQLVDALVNISNSLKAGLSLHQAVDALARESANPMKQEMRLVSQELRLGVTIEDSLEHLLRRMPSPELDLVVSAVTIVRDVGGNLTEVFDNIAFTIRERFRIEGKLSALTAMGRAQAVVISILPFGVILALSILQPGWLDPLFFTNTGLVILAIAAALLGSGIWLIVRMVRIDV